MMFSDYDVAIGDLCGGILTGQIAMYRNGLTNACTNYLQICKSVNTDCKDIQGMVQYILCDKADDPFETKPSTTHPALLQPTPERALVESMILLDYVDEGVLVESFRNYIETREDLTHLYEVCDMFGKQYRKDLDYWIEEARNDYDD